MGSRRSARATRPRTRRASRRCTTPPWRSARPAWSGAAAVHTQGTITFTSGANAGVSATVKSVAAGASLTLAYPLQAAPAPGDAFTVYQGCDHRLTTCQSQFANQANFRGFPFVPPPTVAF
ncbi:MAG: phage BR0599 family protein [Beijerinckiaceae bacterium]|nr:phage BR0599 family protein [Beijerinckiaceae bacterium]